MKLFIWVNPYYVDHVTSTALYVVAETLEQAKATAFDQKFRVGEPFELGEPTQILEAPAAFWTSWSE